MYTVHGAGTKTKSVSKYLVSVDYFLRLLVM